MKLSDVMHRNVEVIAGDTTVREAAKRMSNLDVGSLPVCLNQRLVGLLTDRDVVVRSIARGDDPDETRVSDVMTSKVEWCFEDESIEDASRKMSGRQIQRLVVLDREKKLVGIVSLADLVCGHGETPAVTQTIEAIKAPTKPSAVGVSAGQAGR
ncbi:MAG: CBS domain-containing protein [Labilithrix sp.]|nr:CBS domain-containing protein [Labilithrix sp.]MCW5832405.1 CBS domain-containing protein [Labilithrix sp.]